MGLEITIGYSWTRSASFSNSYNTEISPGQSGYVVFAPTYRVTTGMAKFYDAYISSKTYKPSKDTEIVLREPVTVLGGTLAGTISAIVYNTDEGPPNNPHFQNHCPRDVITEFKTGYTRYGGDCQSTCNNTGTNYYWCYLYITTGDFGIKVYEWEYCATGGRTIYGEKCKGSCGKHGYSYYWCWTYDSWDYCAPKNL